MSTPTQADAPAGSHAEGVIDAEVVDESSPASLEVARRERRNEVLRPLDVEQLAEAFAAYQALIPRLLEESDYQQTSDGRFKKKSAWRKLATAFNLDVELLRDHVDRDEHGQPLRAQVWAIAISPTGRRMVGDGYCSVDERRFKDEKGRQKLENDLRATATTRAKNRAISDLIGAGEVSAEEVDGGSGGPEYGPPLSAKEAKVAKPALSQLLDEINVPDPARHAAAIWTTITERYGYFPAIVTDAYDELGKALPRDGEEVQQAT